MMQVPEFWDFTGKERYKEYLYGVNKQAGLEGRPRFAPPGAYLPEYCAAISLGYDAGRDQKFELDLQNRPVTSTDFLLPRKKYPWE